jgi:hypothetical protein
MKLSVVYQPSLPASTSPYRVCDQEGREFHWANAFLDGQHLRQLSPRSLRIYAYDLLDFARWFEPRHKPSPRSPSPHWSTMFVLNSSKIPSPHRKP